MNIPDSMDYVQEALAWIMSKKHLRNITRQDLQMHGLQLRSVMLRQNLSAFKTKDTFSRLSALIFVKMILCRFFTNVVFLTVYKNEGFLRFTKRIRLTNYSSFEERKLLL